MSKSCCGNHSKSESKDSCKSGCGCKGKAKKTETNNQWA